MTLGEPKERYRAIGEYGLIGDCRSAALVGLDGSIDWCCLPRFDSPSLFAALLDAGKGGQFAVTPQGYYSSSQHYVGNTNVLETCFGTDMGVCTLTDCMPVYRIEKDGLRGPQHLIRLLRCLQGTMSLEASEQPDYSRTPVALESLDGGVIWSSGDVRVTLESSVPLEVSGGTAGGVFTLEEGQEALLVLAYQDGTTGEANDGLTPRQCLQRTLSFWEEKSTKLEYTGDWREQVLRSYLALHLLIYAPTGAIVAAPTTSLPEEIGGVRNWDYRYTLAPGCCLYCGRSGESGPPGGGPLLLRMAQRSVHRLRGGSADHVPGGRSGESAGRGVRPSGGLPPLQPCAHRQRRC